MIVLDTHVLAWYKIDPPKLSPAAVSAISEAREHGGLTIADVTLYELALMIENARITVQGTTEAAVRVFAKGLVLQPITTEIATVAAQLPRDFPGDPADRLIAATARVAGLPLVTADRQIRKCALIETIW